LCRICCSIRWLLIISMFVWLLVVSDLMLFRVSVCVGVVVVVRMVLMSLILRLNVY